MVDKIKRREFLIPLLLGGLLGLLSLKLPMKYLVLGALALVGVVLVLRNLNLGICMGVLLIPFLPDILGLLYLIFLVAAFLYINLFRERSPLGKHFIEAPIMLYLFLITFATITSISPTDSFRDLVLHYAGIGFLMVMINSIDNKESFNRLVSFLVLAATIVSLYGIYQYIVGVEVDRAWVDVENNPDIRTRVYSVFYNPNILAEYLILLTPISVALFWETKRLDKKILFLISSSLMALTIVMTLSRGGWIGFAFSALVFVLLIEKKLLLLGIPVVIGAIYLLPQSIINRILSIKNLSDSSNAYRFKLWEITLDVIRDNKAVGVGFGHLPFKQTFESYIRTMPTYHAHNTFLQTLAELGITGFLIFALMIFIVFKYGILILNRSEDRYIKIMGAGLISGLAGLFLHGLVENILYIPRIIMTFWTVIGLIITLVRIEEKRKTLSDKI